MEIVSAKKSLIFGRKDRPFCLIYKDGKRSIVVPKFQVNLRQILSQNITFHQVNCALGNVPRYYEALRHGGFLSNAVHHSESSTPTYEAQPLPMALYLADNKTHYTP